MKSQDLIAHTASSVLLFTSKADATATNRGFYYQYLILLKRWVEKFIDNDNTPLFTEVDQDIKEVGEKLIFTQVKSYSSSLGLNSKEIKKTLLQFFLLHLKNIEHTQVQFQFCTNTKINSREKLLNRWIEDSEFRDQELKKLCVEKIQKILKESLKERKRKLLHNADTPTKKEHIKNSFEEICSLMASSEINRFTKSIIWKFNERSPEKDIEAINLEIRELLVHRKFQKIPAHLVEGVLLTEIYRCSKNPDESDRELSSDRISQLLKNTQDSLHEYIDEDLLRLMDPELLRIRQDISSLEHKTEQMERNFQELSRSFETTSFPLIQEPIPKNLTVLPVVNISPLYERQNERQKLLGLLRSENCVILSGKAGIGKTLLAKTVVKDCLKDFDHIGWLNVDGSLKTTFCRNPAFTTNLRTDIETWQSEDDRFSIVCNALGTMDGKNLLILDNYEDEPKDFNIIQQIPNWTLLLITRDKLARKPILELSSLSFVGLKAIFTDNLRNRLEPEKKDLEKLFSLVDHNPLVVEVAAKTLSNSLEAELSDFIKYYEEGELDSEELDVFIDVSDRNQPIGFLTYLYNRFISGKLSTHAEALLDFFALLPPEIGDINDLAAIGGSDFLAVNKKHFNNYTHELSKKGLVERNGKHINVSRLIQDLINYENRKKINPFVGHSHMIAWISVRINELSESEPYKSFRFLNFAESILNSIPEVSRNSIRQPLLLLENELLHAYRWTKKPVSLLPKWISLSERANNFLEKNDLNRGVILNNLATCYADCKQIDNAIESYIAAIKIISLSNKPETTARLFTTRYNLATIYFEKEDLANCLAILKKNLKHWESCGSPDHQSIALQYRLIGKIWLEYGDLNAAILHFNMAINLHLSFDKSKRNDFFLAETHCEATIALILLEQKTKGLEHIEKSLSILKGMPSEGNQFHMDLHALLQKLLIQMGETERAVELNAFYYDGL